MCATMWRHLVKATERKITAAYGRVDDLVTCELTACTPGTAPGPTLANEHGRTLPFLLYNEMTIRAHHLFRVVDEHDLTALAQQQ